ncbi:TonB-dependent receptor [Flavihumibacter rivuli]|uniref:SusC/RagA family TonB-linked outer membrane protein n=1 Tax=Flavihumibacter rivuli TaxID=2838156 RepID=UPI001BDF3A4B|nr:TonB-dependent receptor [Flavihumibacter rivuli]ULQ55225.1 TonB-dependent receptor [Flavihumibacter rivuli]
MKKILQRVLLPNLLLLLLTVAWGQGRKVTGKVTDDKGSPIANASVTVKGTSLGTTSTENGEFSLEVPQTATLLEISSLNFQSQEVRITGSTLAISLSPSQGKLDEVVVVGYGTQKITKVSGAIATIKGTEVEKYRPVRAEDAIQGRASGVTVVSPGTPGAKPTVLIRGIPSYTGTDPVVIVDGAIQTLDDLNSINAADIESINILKDAAATAIYGVKGGNGVIVITTKGGRRNQKTEFSYGGNYGIQEVQQTVGVLNATEYAAMANEGSVNSGGGLIFPDISGFGVGTNWQDQIFKTAPIQSHALTARGGSEKMTYFLSGAFLSQGGIVGGKEKSYFDRITGTANLSFDLSSKLKFLVNTSYVNIKGAGIPDNAINGVISNALNFDPTAPIYNQFPGTYGRYSTSPYILSEIVNPLTQLENTYNESNTNKLYGKLELQYEVIKNLKLYSRFGYTYTNVTGKSFNPLVYYGSAHINSTLNADGTPKAGAHNNVAEYSTNYFNFAWENFANYQFSVAEDHHFETVLGFSVAKNTGSSLNGSRQDVPFNSWDYADISSATGTAPASGLDVGSFQYERRNLSYFGRVNYDYKDRYLASLTVRRDGSYAFGPNNKFANFYAGSLGWVVSSEDFFQSDFIDFLKVRASYGATGNENVSPQFQRISTAIYSYGLGQNSGYTFGNEPTSIGATIASFRNDNLGWEKQVQINAGFDLRFFKNKFSLSADYFRKDISGLLFTPTLSLYLGTAALPTANIGTTETSGFDLNLGYTDQLGKNFKLNTYVTFTTAKNLVTETNNGLITGGGYGIPFQSVTRFEKGFTPGYFFGWKTDGLFQNEADIAKAASQPGAQPGDIRYVDINQDGVIDGNDRTQIGDPFPDFTMGWGLNLEYKGFDFSSFVYASYGNDVYRAFERNLAMTNKFRSVLGRWTGEGSTNDAKTPRYSFIDANNNTRASDRYVEDGSFIKIKDLQLGYTIPAETLRKLRITRLRVYAQVKNAYTFTKYSGFDPEISGGIFDTGIDRGVFPQARIWSMGIDLKF